jgi:hypothetical protein
MYRLSPHPATLPVVAEGLSLMWMQLGDGLHQLTFTLENAARLMVPQPASRERADGLWQATCFELFLRRQAGPGYFEFNFSPSQRWAAYSFEKYREGMAEFAMAKAPLIQGAFQGDRYLLRVQVSGLPEDMTVASASAVVIEMGLPDPAEPDGAEADGAGPEGPMVPKASYWSLVHPRAAPDFHHPASFVLPLAPGFR